MSMKENLLTSRWFTMVREMPEPHNLQVSSFYLQITLCFFFLSLPVTDAEFQKFTQRKAHCMNNFEKPVVMKVRLRGSISSPSALLAGFVFLPAQPGAVRCIPSTKPTCFGAGRTLCPGSRHPGEGVWAEPGGAPGWAKLGELRTSMSSLLQGSCNGSGLAFSRTDCQRWLPKETFG